MILRSESSEVVRCGINVIETHRFGPSIYEDIYDQEFLEGSDGDHDIDYYETSFEESEVESDRMIPSPPYHLLHHPRHGSMRFSTRQQWQAFLIRAFSLWKIIDMQKFSPHDHN